jgi:bacillolysin
MKKLFLLSSILCLSHVGFTQNKFKTVKRSDVVIPQETLDKPVDNSSFQNTIARPKYLTTPSDNQTYMNLISKKSGLKITVDENGMPTVIEGIPTNLSNIKKGSVRNARMSAVAASAYNYLEAVKPYLKLANPDAELNILNSQEDEIQTTHLRMQQMYKGVPVYGGEMILHKKDNEDVSLLNGHFYPTPQIENVKPSLSDDNVGKLAISDVSKSSIVKPMTATEMTMLKYEKPKTELMIYHQNEKADGERLAYQVTVRPNFLERWIYVIDANSGEILDKYNHTCTLDGTAKATATDLNGVSRGINTYQSGSSYVLIDATKSMFKGGAVQADDPQGVIWTIDATGSKVSDDLTIRQISSTNNTWNNSNGVSAHYNAGLAYDYYKSKHNRTSLNGKGGTIVSIINITDENGKGFDNAFWNGEYMGYGSGGTLFKPLAGGLDVAGHEMTHGVIENTANLEYKSQSGAINESLADCFGALVENKSGANLWRLGEDVMKGTAYPSGALRDLSNPNQGGRSLNDNGYQPANMNQYYTGSQDNYGVHINSGVPNNAFYRFATASGMNLTKAEKVYYRALTLYLTRTSKFLDLRRAVIQSATDLKASAGITDADINAAKSAFDAVGVTDGTPPTPTTTPPTTPTTTPKTDIPVNNGTEGLLTYDPVAKTLYKSSVKGEADQSSFVELAKNIVIDHKPTVPDDGTFAYFVPADGFIKRVNLSGTPKVENVSSTGVWRNAAISKDGKKLAALRKLGTTSAATDKQITVVNLLSSTGASKTFTLYNPTYTQGVSTGQVQNADAIEWDYLSENLVYDAFNTIKSATGTESTFWDVGFINAWNGSKNDFGTGEIDKLFTSLDAGENIGNPSFSKNSTNIIAFDYFIEKDNVNYVIGVNTERTDGLDFIYENNTLGYPEYSKTDDFVLYNYSTTDSKTNKDVLNTYQITMDKSRIKSVAKSEKYLVGQSAYAVWYTVGTRVLPTKQNQTINFTKIPDKLVGDPAFDLTVSASSNLAVGLSLTYGPAALSGKRVTLSGTAGRVKINAFQDGSSSFYNIAKADSFCVNPLKPTISVVKKTDANGDYWEYTSSAATGNVWYRDGTILESLRGFQVVQIVSGSKFNVQVVTADGCGSALSDARQDPALVKPLSAEPALEASVTVSPNPSSDEIRIVVPKNIKIESAKLFSISGSQVVEKQGDKSNTMTMNIHNLTKGNYVLQIMTNEGIVAKKVVKE